MTPMARRAGLAVFVAVCTALTLCPFAHAETSAFASATKLTSLPLVESELNVVFIPIIAADAFGKACPGTTTKASFTIPQLRKVLFAESNPKGVTVGSSFNTCSYGKTKLTAKNSALVDWVKLPCKPSGSVAGGSESCSYEEITAWADAADANLKAQGFPLANYKYRVYILPPTLPSSCSSSMVGLGTMGCDREYPCRTWIGHGFWNRPSAYVHDLSHNALIGHAGTRTNDGSFDELGDDTCAGGYCCANRCFNTPHAWQLGWLKVRELDATSLKPGQTVTASVPSQSLSDSGSLRIVPSWAKGAPGSIFVGFRTKAGGDVGLNSYFVNKIHIYTTDIKGSKDPSMTTLEASLQSGQSWCHPDSGIVVRVDKVTPKAAEVRVCRKGGADPTCKKLL